MLSAIVLTLALVATYLWFPNDGENEIANAIIKEPQLEPETDELEQSNLISKVIIEDSDSSVSQLSDSANDQEEESSPTGNLFVWGTIQTDFGIVVPREQIKLYSKSVNKGYTATSDENGYFTFPDVVPALDYHLSVAPKGLYQRVSMESLAISNNQIGLPITLHSMESGTLNGRVVNLEGVAIPNYDIKIQSPLKSRWLHGFKTDAIGEFHIKNVPIGPVSFTKTFGQAMIISGHQYLGESQPAIELIVDIGRYSLTGVALDPYNDPIPGATVILSWRHDNGMQQSIINRRDTTTPDGNFSFYNLGPGDHDLLITIAGGLYYNQIVDVGIDDSNMVVVLKQKSDTEANKTKSD